jgi:aspartyl-tRNA(Asn)/glutamyl-tRNA(Gln) amidotransferase subunit A
VDYLSQQEKILDGSLRCTALVENCLSNIEKSKDLNAFLEVFEESALQRAQEIDQKISEGKAGKLAGMIVGLKDNICYKGHHVSASSKILEGFESVYNATVVDRLLAEDAIIIGRLNCDEFAMGSSNENSAFGNVKNPVDHSLVPGGSSGGSAAAVKAGLCHITLGSDTGGSIRQPASFCGTVGFKPSYGAVSRYGLIAYASSFDQIGPFANTVEDCALVCSVIYGKDEFDATMSSKNLSELDLKPESKKRKIALIKETVAEGVNEEVKKRTLEIVSQLKAEGHEVEEISFPYLEHMVPTYYVLTTAEASSNLARFDGVHYGYRSPNATDLESTYTLSRSEGFGPEVKRRIMLGTFVLSSGYYDAYYQKGQKVRRLIQQKTNEILAEFDFILSPTCPTPAFKIGENVDDPITMYLQDIFTVQANLAGIPAISLPLGEDAEKKPFGIQLMAKQYADQDLLSFSHNLMGKFNVN